MPYSCINHLSIHATDVAESQRFYEEFFGAEAIPMPNMGGGGQWLKLGDVQLHLIGPPRPATVSKYQHFAVSVDDFAEFYRLVREQNVPEDDSMWGFPLNVLPSGQVQYYVRDPTGNLVEVNHQDASGLPVEILERAEYQTQRLDQTPDQLKAELFLKKRDDVTAGVGK